MKKNKWLKATSVVLCAALITQTAPVLNIVHAEEIETTVSMDYNDTRFDFYISSDTDEVTQHRGHTHVKLGKEHISMDATELSNYLGYYFITPQDEYDGNGMMNDPGIIEGTTTLKDAGLWPGAEAKGKYPSYIKTLPVPDDSRRVGMTFDGWYYSQTLSEFDSPNGDGFQKATENTTVAEVYNSIYGVNLYAKWIPDINANLNNISVIKTKDKNGKLLSSNIKLYSDEGITETKESDFYTNPLDYNGGNTTTKEFYTYVTSDAEQIGVNFDVYEPDVNCKIEYSSDGSNYTEITDRVTEYVNKNNYVPTLTEEEKNPPMDSVSQWYKEKGEEDFVYPPIPYVADNIYSLDYSDTDHRLENIDPGDPDEIIEKLNNPATHTEGDKKEGASYSKLYTTQDTAFFEVDKGSRYKKTPARTSQLIWANNIPIEDSDNNTIKFTVTPLNTKEGHPVEYIIHVKRSPQRIELNYGNSLYGQFHSQANGEANKAAFDETYTYNGLTYSADAWKNSESDSVEIPVGSKPQSGEYINYDKDETAVIAYSGSAFTDPGVTLYDSDGNVVTPGGDNQLTRTITYDVIKNRGIQGWADIEKKTSTYTYTGGENDNIISDLKNNGVIKPGVYQIQYDYTAGGKTASAVRSLVVLPKPGDTNLDNYVNSLDMTVYQNFNMITTGSSSSRDWNLYKYRALDLNLDGSIDENDRNLIHTSRVTGVPYRYTDLSVKEGVDRTEYSASESADSSKAQIYMDYLKMNESGVLEKTDVEELNKDDVFWIGYRIEGVNNANAADVFNKNVYSMTMSLDYDYNFIRPANGSGEDLFAKDDDWKNYIRTYNFGEGMWNGYDFNVRTTNRESYNYTVDSSRAALDSAFVTTNASNIYTMIFDIKANDAALRKLANGDYLVKLPMKLQSELPTDSRKIISFAPGSKVASMSFGDKGEALGASWNSWTSGDNAPNGASNNLNGIVEYMGDIKLEKAQPDVEFVDIETTGVYGEQYQYNNTELMNGVYAPYRAAGEYGVLTPGLNFNANTGTISGHPQGVGTYSFYIGSKVYRITINKKDINVYPAALDENGDVAEHTNIGKMYGEENPSIATYYDGLAFSETNKTIEAEEGTTAPSWTTTLEKGADFGISADITNSAAGSSAHYNFIPQTGKMAVDEKRPLTITNIADSAIPRITSKEALDKTNQGQTIWSKDATASTGNGTLTVENLYGSDRVSVSFRTNYSKDLTPGENKEVTIDNVALQSRYVTPDNNNYSLERYTATYYNGIIDPEKLVSIRRISDPNYTYTYGDKLSLSNGRVQLIYDSGREPQIPYSMLKDNNLGLYMYNKYLAANGDEDQIAAAEIDDSHIMSIADNGDRLHIVSKDDPTKTLTMIDTFNVSQKTLTVTASSRSHVYGQPISDLNITKDYTCKGFVAGDTIENIVDPTSEHYDATFQVPAVTCTEGDNTPVGTVKGALVPSGQTQSRNYVFEYVSGDLTTTPRKISLASITKEAAIPMLQASVYMPGGVMGTPPWVIDGAARIYADENGSIKEDQSEAAVTGIGGDANSGLYKNDDIRITYDIQYDTIEMKGQPHVGVILSNFKLDTENGRGGNYELITDSFTNPVNLGRIDSDFILNFEVKTPPETMEYTYGTPLDLSKLQVEVTKDSGAKEIATESTLSNFGLSVVRTKNSVDYPVKTGDKLECSQTNSALYIVGNVINNSKVETKRIHADPANTTLIVNQKRLQAKTQSKTITYGDFPYIQHLYEGFAYSENELDASFRDGLTEPEIKLRNGDGDLFNESDKLVAGTYDIVLQNGSAKNYEFVYDTDKKLTVNKRKLDINAIRGIPPLTAADVATGEWTHEKTGFADNVEFDDPSSSTGKSVNLDLTNLATDGQSAWDKDLIRITYTAIYSGTDPTAAVRVSLRDVKLDDGGDKKYNNNSYELRNIVSVAQGSVESNEVSKIEIKTDPKIEYTYGEYFNLNSGSIDVEYDGGNRKENLTLSSLPKEVLVYAVSPDDSTDRILVTDSDKLDISKYNGRILQLVSKSVNGDSAYVPVTAEASKPISVSQKELHVTADDITAIYGENIPEFTFAYSEDELEYGETLEDALNDGKELSIACAEVSAAANSGDRIAAGSYDIVITVPDGMSDNYKIVPVNSTLTISKRVLVINSISNIPSLTSQKLFNERTDRVHVVSATAGNDGMDIAAAGESASGYGLMDGDSVEISYEAVYTNTMYDSVTAQMDNVSVSLQNIKLTANNDSDNYTLNGASLPSSSNSGTVYPKKFSAIEIQEDGQPKTDYHYADKLDLSKRGVTIKYDSGEVLQNISYNDLQRYNVFMKYSDTSEERSPVNGETVTAAYHNNKKIVIYTPDEYTADGCESVETDPLQVEKHIIKLTADDITMTYGDTIMSDVEYDINGLKTEGGAMHTLTYSYNQSDLINGDTEIEGLDNLRIRCSIGGEAVNEKTPCRTGGYEISMEGAVSDNYDFEYEQGHLTINKCVIDVVSVTTPEITSADLYNDYLKSVEENNPEINLHHTYSYAAKNQGSSGDEQIAVLTNVKNNDTVGITFTATYDVDYYGLTKPEITETKTPVKAKLSEIELDSSSANNYILKDHTASPSALQVISDDNTFAMVNRREITKIEVTKSPRITDYIYEETFNADDLTVTVTYNSGEVAENIGYDKIINKDGTDDSYSRFVTLKREDGTDARTGDKLTCDVTGGNGQHVYLRAQTQAQDIANPIEIDLGVIGVAQKELILTADDIQSTYGDEISSDAFTYKITYKDNDQPFVTDTAAVEGFVPPTMDCYDNTTEETVNEKTHVSPEGYEIIPSQANARDYKFEYRTGTLSIVPREIDVTSVDVPDVTSANLYEDYLKSVETGNENLNKHHTYTYTASNQPSGEGQSAAVITNVANNDIVLVTFKASYDTDYYSQKETESVKSKLSDFEIDANMPFANDYTLNSSSLQVIRDDNTQSVIHRREITGMEIVKNLKLGDYIFGETFDADDLLVAVKYDSGETANASYAEIINSSGDNDWYSRFITLKREDGKDVRTGDELSVDRADGNGQHIYLTAQTSAQGIESPITIDLGTIAVYKKFLTIKTADKQSVYGEEIPSDLYEYTITDTAEGKDIAISDMPADFIPPVIVCREDENDENSASVSSKTHVREGGYSIAASGAKSNDFGFKYDNGTLEIVPRVIDITSMTVPELTSAKLYADFLEGKTYHTIDGFSQNKPSEDADICFAEMTNVVNDDTVSVRYKVTYTANYPDFANMAEKVDAKVSVTDVELDSESICSLDYKLKDKVLKEDGTYDKLTVIENDNIMGVINTKKPAAFEISNGGQPKLDYVYGDTLDLSAKGLTIIYDSGEVTTGIAFSDAEKYGIVLKYSDTDEEVHDGDKLSVAKHNGKSIVLTAPYTDKAVSTNTLHISKKPITIIGCEPDSIVYDGKTTQTTGKVIFDGVVEGDEISADAVFKFDDALAGDNKKVTVTDITLSGDSAINYTIEPDSASIQGTGSILKADAAVRDGAKAEFTESAITVTPPAMTDDEISGGMTYEYSIDGGKTWSKNPVFTDIDAGQEYDVWIRIGQSGNYNASLGKSVGTISTSKLKLIIEDKDTKQTLKTVFTDTTEFADEASLIKVIDLDKTIYSLYAAESGARLIYPLTMSGTRTLYAQMKSSQPGNNNGGGSNRVPTPKPTAAPEASPTPKPTVSPTPSVSVKKRYVDGKYGMVYPDDPLTRAEAAKMFAVQFDNYSDKDEYNSEYPDVAKTAWYYRYISFADGKDIISGFDDGLYYPEINMTRAEFTSVAARYMGIEPSDKKSTYPDVRQDAWYRGYIMALADKDIISGYTDGTYHPEEKITRAEAITIINHITEREYSQSEIDKWTCPFSDLPKNHWAYYEIMIASNDLIRK